MKCYLRCLFLLILINWITPSREVFGQVGREYGNPKMPILISHIAEKHRRMIYRGNSPPHNFFTKIICFKWPCRNQARINKNLHAISFSRFKKKIRKNAKKGLYKKNNPDQRMDKREVAKDALTTISHREDSVINDSVEVVPYIPILKADSIIILNEILFEVNSASLKIDQFPKLDSVVNFLTLHPSLVVKITGHTDNTGSEARNVTLSTNRAKVIAEYLIKNHISVDRITFRGIGSTVPLDSNNTKLGRSRNRRVELLMHDLR